VDRNTSQWINTVYKELSSYEQIREAITEFMWGPGVQARWQCALCHSMYDRIKDRSITAHFLCYSMVANNLMPKLTESDMVDIISSHYPAFVQCKMLSAGTRTIRGTLNLLNKLNH